MLNHELAAANSRRTGGTRPRSTSGSAPSASPAAVSGATNGRGITKSIGTNTRTTGTVKPSWTGKRTRDATARQATAISAGPASKGWSMGSASAMTRQARRKPPPTTASATHSRRLNAGNASGD